MFAAMKVAGRKCLEVEGSTDKESSDIIFAVAKVASVKKAVTSVTKVGSAKEGRLEGRRKQ